MGDVFSSSEMFLKVFLKLTKISFFLILLFPASFARAAEYAIIPQDMYEVFQSGDFTWVDIIQFLFHLIQLLLQLAGIAAVLLIMYAGFQIILGSITENKDAGKQTIRAALIGLVVIALSWILVDLVISLMTSQQSA